VDLDVVLGCQLAMNLVPRHNRLHRGSALIDDSSVFHVQRDPQPEDVPRSGGNATVAEVKAEEVDVGCREAVEPVVAGTAAGAAEPRLGRSPVEERPALEGVRESSRAPFPNRRPGYLHAPRDLAVVQPTLRET